MKFRVGPASFEVIGDGIVQLAGYSSSFSKASDTYMVPNEVSNDNKNYKVVGMKKYASDIYCMASSGINKVYFDDNSIIEEIPTSFIEFTNSSTFFLPPSIKRVRADAIIYGTCTKIVCNKNNKYVSVIKERSIINHYPLEFIWQSSRRKIVSIRETVRIVGISAFAFNKFIRSIVVPSSVETIDDRAFYKCDNLNKVIFKANSRLNRIGGGAFYSTLLKCFEFPSSVVEVGEKSFMECKVLRSIIFPDNSCLRKIGQAAFNKTDIKSIVIPASVVKIGSYAFCCCHNLSSVSYEGNESSIKFGNSVFFKTKLG